jgi:hypothetical protein
MAIRLAVTRDGILSSAQRHSILRDLQHDLSRCFRFQLLQKTSRPMRGLSAMSFGVIYHCCGNTLSSGMQIRPAVTTRYGCLNQQ